ncbi:26S proteasome IOTA SU [Guillardia theta]|uniref:26S proteasome IOTA SU n=1 Tax=Guillardia theta TaxID=55529 RepID=Q9XG34_GUITH|nr:26S proteasome IOTA SU [Guillardia theta]CAB40400.1 26S proteasome IOTA SU [Guillardia theta]
MTISNELLKFAPSGRIFQIEYAVKKKKGSICIGIKNNSFLIFLLYKSQNSSSESNESDIIFLDDKTGCLCNGLAIDVYEQIEEIKNIFFNYYSQYRSKIQTSYLSKLITFKNQYLTHYSFSRPRSTNLIIFNLDNELGGQLFKGDNTGSFILTNECSIGYKDIEIEYLLKKKKPESFQNIEKSVEKLLEVLITSIKDELVIENIRIFFTSGDKNVKKMESEKIRDIFRKIYKKNLSF